jgi:hypothetical protein
MNMRYQGPGAPISEDGMNQACERLNCDVETLWALLTVETRGFGFQHDRRPKILFERHIFHGLTDGLHDRDHPNLSASVAGGYTGGAEEYSRLQKACTLNEAAALKSTSWGLGQIMGFNAEKLGYASVGEMIDSFVKSEDAQLEGVCRFIQASSSLHKALCQRDWKKVAFYYNGSAYARNEYDAKLHFAYERYVQQGCPDVNVRAAQAYLTYLGFEPRGIDGVKGRNTISALNRFQASEQLETSDTINVATVKVLQSAFARRPG